MRSGRNPAFSLEADHEVTIRLLKTGFLPDQKPLLAHILARTAITYKHEARQLLPNVMLGLGLSLADLAEAGADPEDLSIIHKCIERH